MTIGQTPTDYDGPLPELDQAEPLGTSPPSSAEETHARDIIAAAPNVPPPYAVARWLYDNRDDASLVDSAGNTLITSHDLEAWPTEWNPLIVEFFKATTYEPSGDTTPWCAAFLNWCIKQCDEQGTNSASSQSFINFAGATTVAVQNAMPGDIVVFTLNQDTAHGHVAFFVSRPTDGEIQALGGNQIASGHHEIIEKPIPYLSQRDPTKSGFFLSAIKRIS